MFTFNVSLDQKNDTIYISGASFNSLDNDLKKYYGTSAIGTYMLRREKGDGISTKEFFLVELHFVIGKILQLKNIRSNRRRLVQLRDLLETETWLKDTVTPSGTSLDTNKIKQWFHKKPFDKQKHFLEQYPIIKQSYKLRGLLLDGKAGSGKTLTAIMWSKLLGSEKTVVLCPLNTLENVWVKQIAEHYITPPRVWTSTSGYPLTAEYDYYVVHYDYLSGSQFDIFKDFLGTTIKRSGKQFKLIVDESQNFADPTSLRSKRLIDLADCEFFCDAICMSGTLVKNAATELYTVFCVIDPLFVKRARLDFMKVYGRSREKLNELMRHRLGRNKFTIPEIQGLGEAPETETIKISFPGAEKYTLDALRMEMQGYVTERFAYYKQHMTDYLTFFNDTVNEYTNHVAGDSRLEEEVVRYRAIVKKFRARGYSPFEDVENSKFAKSVEEKIEARLKGRDLRDFRHIKSAVKYLDLKLRGEALGYLGKRRMAAIKDIIEHVKLENYIDNVENKTVIYTSYVEVLKEVEAYVIRKGYDPLTVHGENNNIRDETVKKFMENETFNPLVTTFGSLKEGTSLVAANQIIMMNAPWRDYEVVQVKARIWRIPQASPCFFWLVDLDTGTKLNITSRTINILDWSREQVEQLLDRNDGNMLFTDVSGLEENVLWDMSEETPPPRVTSKNALSIFM